MWTVFHDQGTGDEGRKESFGCLYIEAPEEEAISVFYSRYGHDPFRVSCTYCGWDYWVEELDPEETPEDYEDNLYLALESGEAVVVPANEIGEEERTVEVPVQGWVWMGGK